MFWVPARNGCLKPRVVLELLLRRKSIVSGCKYGSNFHCIFDGCISSGGFLSGLVCIRHKSFFEYFHRTIYSGAFCYSKHYPDFFIDSNRNGSISTTDPVKVLEILQAVNEKKDYQRGIQVFADFQREKPDWFKQWPAQRIAALILHMYLQAGFYHVLFALYDDLHRNGFVHGEGIYVTLIKSCIAIQDIPRALVFLEELKRNGIRNIRIYGHIIVALINDDSLGMAFRLFKEMQHYELNQKTRKQFKDQDMLSSLLSSAASGVEHYDGGHDDDDGSLRTEVVSNLFSYLHTRGITISPKLKNAIIKAITTFSKDFSMAINKRSDIKKESGGWNESNDCKVTGTDVEQFARLLRLTKKSSNFFVEEERLHDFVAKYGPFSAIVDGANVMLARKSTAKNNLTKIKEKNIFDVLASYRQLFHLDKSLIIIPSTMERRSMLTQSQCFERLQKEYHAKIFVAEEISDDVALLLATIYNDIYLRDEGLHPNTMLITNDSLRDHISVLAQDQFKFKLWLKSKQLYFTWDFNDEIVLDSTTLPIGMASGKWSLQLWNGEVMTVVKK